MNQFLLKPLLLVSLVVPSLWAQDEYKADCLILEDENSIICKYIAPSKEQDVILLVKWIDPNNEISRTREVTLFEGHRSIYDFRYLKGRGLGVWTFEVHEGETITRTNFTIEKKDQ
ncbi:MAG: hypothetical protein U9N30_06140 [Campylobacterota bacterium]|nr:hypothetical protein [Campylobacterota bacterium]